MEEKTPRTRLMDRYRQIVLADFQTEDRRLVDNKYFEIPYHSLQNLPGIRIIERWSFHLRFGFMRWIDLRFPDGTTSQNIFWRPLWLIEKGMGFPFRLLFWRKLWMRKYTQGLTFEKYLPGEESRPIDYREVFIEGKRGSSEAKRIEHLINHSLEFVDRRGPEEGSSKLYKDPKDSRLWQWSEAPDKEDVVARLTHVTQEQWIYFYVEKKEGTRGAWGEEEEAEFYEALEEDPRGGTCEETDCSSTRVKYSGLCRDHHFLAIRGHSYKSGNISQ